MADVEIDSFLRKFKSLRDAGYKASLTFDTDLGEVNISLSCKVGRVVPPPSPSQNIYPCTPPPQLVASSVSVGVHHTTADKLDVRPSLTQTV